MWLLGVGPQNSPLRPGQVLRPLTDLCHHPASSVDLSCPDETGLHHLHLHPPHFLLQCLHRCWVTEVVMCCTAHPSLSNARAPEPHRPRSQAYPGLLGCWAGGQDATCLGADRALACVAATSSALPSPAAPSSPSQPGASPAVSASSSWEADSPVLRSSVSSDVSSEI